jgi:hypothetical protein
METVVPIDLTPVKRRQQATWSSSDYAVIGTTLAITSELLCEAVDLSTCGLTSACSTSRPAIATPHGLTDNRLFRISRALAPC